MESDREIIRQFGVVLSDGILQVCWDLAWPVLIGSMVSFATYKIARKIYIKRKVSAAAYRHRMELNEAESKLLASIEKWLQSEEYEQQLGQCDGQPVEEYVASLTFQQLTAALQSGKLRALSVLKTYQMKAVARQAENNCIVAWIPDAEGLARQLDALAPEERGPLHGIPISVKECFFVRGTYSTSGLVRFFHERNTVDCPAVQTVLQLGAIPFCKTNIPQTMYSMECGNPLFGTTTNPHNKNREAGGSSGGEGSLLGGQGSILGIGSDIGGSLRNPAAYCGHFSLKPTVGRHLCHQDTVAPVPTPPVGLTPIAGFMSGSAFGLVHAWRHVWNLQGKTNPARFDASIAPLPFNEGLFAQRPRIGFFFDNSILEPVPAARRAVTAAIARLEAAGYEVVGSFGPPPFPQIFDLFNGLLLADGGAGLAESLVGDVVDASLRGLHLGLQLYHLPAPLRWPLEKIAGRLTKIPPLAQLYSTAPLLMRGLQTREQLVRAYLERMDRAGIDIILCPGQLTPAPPCGENGLFVPVVFPYIAWNVLNFPAGIAPITKFNEEDQEAMKTYPTNDQAYQFIHRHCQGAEGMPMAVQVVGRPYHEEQVLHVLEALERLS